MRSLIFLTLVVCSFGACKTAHQIPYFSMPVYDSSHLFVHESYDVPLQVGDQLTFVISALNLTSAAIYNFPPGARITIDQEGMITFPQLGRVRVTGLTRPQLSLLLETRLKTYLTDPAVYIEFSNFKVTMMGEIGSQGPISVPDGKLNILEAIAKSGDILPYGKKHQVQIIREANGKREFGWINLYSPAIFTSPYFRLRQNDIIYVHPTDDKPLPKNDKFNKGFATFTSVVGIVTTIIFLVTQVSR